VPNAPVDGSVIHSRSRRLPGPVAGLALSRRGGHAVHGRPASQLCRQAGSGAQDGVVGLLLVLGRSSDPLVVSLFGVPDPVVEQNERLVVDGADSSEA
jgi:hypothetical protein